MPHEIVKLWPGKSEQNAGLQFNEGRRSAKQHSAKN
jgi:hypothetical protein